MPTYVIDAERTRLTVAVPGLLRTQGQFTRIAGTVTVDEHGNFQSLEVTIDARSLRTGLLPRDLHLSTATFLDARRHPVVTYQSAHAEPVGPDRYAVQGVLRLHGHEHPVALTVTLEQDVAADGAHRAHVSGIVPRDAFAIPRNPVLRALMLPLIGNEVAVTADVCATLAHQPADITPLPMSRSRG